MTPVHQSKDKKFNNLLLNSFTTRPTRNYSKTTVLTFKVTGNKVTSYVLYKSIVLFFVCFSFYMHFMKFVLQSQHVQSSGFCPLLIFLT